MLAWQQFTAKANRDNRARMYRQVMELRFALDTRLEKQRQVLLGLKGLIVAQEKLTPAQWRDYVRALDLHELNGALGYGLVRPVKSADAASFSIRSPINEGPTFPIQSHEAAPDLMIVEYLEPATAGFAGLGFDLASHPASRAAAIEAVEKNTPALTSPLDLTPASSPTPGLLLLAPVYREGASPATTAERWQHLLGWVYVPLKIDELLTGIHRPDPPELNLVFRTNEAHAVSPLIYTSTPAITNPLKPVLSPFQRSIRQLYTDRTFTVFGRQWELKATHTHDFQFSDDDKIAWLALMAGLLASGLVTWQIYRALARREHEERMAQNTVHELHNLENLQQTILNSTRVAIMSTDADGVIRSFNPAAEALLGYPACDVIGQKTPAQFHEATELAERAAALSSELNQTIEPGWAVLTINATQQHLLNEHDWTYLRRDGSRVPVRLTVSPVYNREGVLLGYIALAMDISDHRATLNQVQAAHEEARSALHEVEMQRRALDHHAIVSVTDPRGRIEYVNEKFCAISGYTPSELIGQDHRLISAKHHAPEFWRNFWATLQAGRIWHGEICNRHKNGSLYWVSATMVPHLNPAGEIAHIVAIRTDITAHKQALIALENEKVLFDVLADSLSDAVYFKDRQSRFLRVNRQMAKNFGVTNPADLIGKTDFDFFAEAHARPAYEDEQLIMATGIAKVAYEEKEVWPDGHVTWVLTTKAPMRDVHGRVIGLVGSSRDITARKEADLALRASEERFRALSAACPVGVFLGDAQHRCIYTNDRCDELTGLTGRQRHGLSWLRAVHPGDMKEVRLQWKNAAAAKAEFAGEFRFRSRDGRTPWIAARARPIISPDGALLGYVGTLEDITIRREQAASLRLAKETAEAANRAKSEFLALISHEIRTPMNSVVGFANLLLDTPLEQQQREYVDILRSAGENLIVLINDILDFSKIEAGKLEVEHLRFDALETITTIVKTLSPQVQEKQLWLRIEAAPNLPRILHADPMRMRQVVINLVGNALKFTAQGGVTIAIDPVANDGPRRARFRIIDTGIGIAADKQARLFQSYTQIDASTTRQYGGTGLGLAISKRLIELMGGTMGLTSAPNKGSCFWFELPLSADQSPLGTIALVQPPVAQPPVPPRSSAQLAPKIAPAFKHHALAVDDNPVNLQLCQAFLAKLGYASTTAKNGLEALTLMQTKSFDVVIMDHQMPIMDGCTATQAYRAWETQQGRATRLPIIALTANAGSHEAEYYLSVGMDYFLSKPLLLPRLSEALQQTVPTAVESPDPKPTSAPPIAPPPPKVSAPSPDASAGPLINRAAAMDLAGQDAALLSLLATAFMSQCPELRAGIRSALAQEDGPALVRHAHKLKGAVSVFAVDAIWSTAQAMNKASVPYDWPHLRRQGAQLDADLERLLPELAALQTPPVVTTS